MTESIWMLHAKKADFNALAGRFHISPVTARIIRNRDIESEEEFDRYLNGSLEDLYSPGLCAFCAGCSASAYGGGGSADLPGSTGKTPPADRG